MARAWRCGRWRCRGAAELPGGGGTGASVIAGDLVVSGGLANQGVNVGAGHVHSGVDRGEKTSRRCDGDLTGGLQTVARHEVRHAGLYRFRYTASMYLHHGVLGVPTVFKYKGIRFFFYSNEGNPREPVHIHAKAGGKDAKLWLHPSVRIASCEGFSRAEQVELQVKSIRSAWNEHFGESDGGTF